jgi:DNA-binding NtrC family response regulator
MHTPVRLVTIDDDPRILDVIEKLLAQPGLEILKVSDPIEGLQAVSQTHPDIVILDLVMPKLGGMQVLEKILELNPGTEVVLLTGEYSPKVAVEAIQKGASDYLTKPIDSLAFQTRIGTLIAAARDRRRAAQLERDLLQVSQFEGMIGRSPEMLGVFVSIRRIAPHYRTVLITGATGTGKELAAAALHRLSPVAGKPFVICNCAAVVDTLFESELFGHVKGAFTGAVQDRAGLFETANHGTLFLDEIGEVPLALQSKLLRVLQQKEIQRVGSPSIRRVDVRIIAATNRDLHGMVAAKEFREDLYYRLAMIELKLPRLALRKEDLPLLTPYFVEKYAEQFGKTVRTITRRAQTLLSRYTWPGNVRELENAIGHACMMTSTDTIDVGDLPDYLRSTSEEASFRDEEMLPLAEINKRHARFVLGKVGGNKQYAAEILGISRTTLYRLIEE